MAKFELYFDKLMNYEGGYSNHPSDKGGETNKGITFSVFKQYSKNLLNLEPTLDNLKKLTDKQAYTLYKYLYWDKIKADSINSQSVAEILFDWSVNSGVGLASRKIQKLLNLSQDGIIGTKTITEINNQNPLTLFNNIKDLRKRYYSDIILANPKLKVFEKGWNNRLNSFKFVS